jgi:hypothetical protein
MLGGITYGCCCASMHTTPQFGGLRASVGGEMGRFQRKRVLTVRVLKLYSRNVSVRTNVDALPLPGCTTHDFAWLDGFCSRHFMTNEGQFPPCRDSGCKARGSSVFEGSASISVLLPRDVRSVGRTWRAPICSRLLTMLCVGRAFDRGRCCLRQGSYS